MTNNQLTNAELREMITALSAVPTSKVNGASFGDIAAALIEVLASREAPCGFFSYGSEHGFDFHKTSQDAVDAAEAAIDDYRGDACDGWSEEVDSICWGVIMQTSTKVGVRPRTADDSCDPSIDTVCDYALLPEVVHE